MKRLVKALAVMSVLSMALTSFSYLAYAQTGSTTGEQPVAGALEISQWPGRVTLTEITSTGYAQNNIMTMLNSSTQSTDQDSFGPYKVLEVTKTTNNAASFSLTFDMTGDFVGNDPASGSALTPIESTSLTIQTADAFGTATAGIVNIEGVFIPGNQVHANTTASASTYAGSAIEIMNSSGADTLTGQFAFTRNETLLWDIPSNDVQGWAQISVDAPAGIVADTYTTTMLFSVS